MKNGKIKIKKLTKQEVDQTEWRPTSESKYIDVYRSVASLKIGEGVEVEATSSGLGTAVRKYCHKNVKGNYVLRAKQFKKSGTWRFKKEAK